MHTPTMPPVLAETNYISSTETWTCNTCDIMGIVQCTQRGALVKKAVMAGFLCQTDQVKKLIPGLGD